jgi:hypothetical protein
MISVFWGYLPEDSWFRRSKMKRGGRKMLFWMEKPAGGLFSGGMVKMEEIFEKGELVLYLP